MSAPTPSNVLVAVPSLVDLACHSAVKDKSLLSQWINFIPKTGNFLYPLLQAAIVNSRLLSLNVLLSSWPLKKVILKDCEFFNEEKAILMATCLQQESCRVGFVDIRGCEIGYYGTAAFAKLAINITVSEAMISAMKMFEDTQPTHASIRTSLPAIIRPLNLLLDCYVDKDNYGLVKDAIIKHTRLNFLVCSLQISELGTRRICQLLNNLEVCFFCSSFNSSIGVLLETNKTNGSTNVGWNDSGVKPFDFYLSKKSEILEKLNLSMNSLESYGMMAISPKLTRFVNLSSLDLSYNNITSADAAASLAQACHQLQNLKRLNLTGNRLGSHICVVLRELSCKLTHLFINGCHIGEDELAVMTTIDQVSQLEQLEIASNGLERGFRQLRKFLLHISKTLQHLDVSENGFYSQSIPKLCKLFGKLVNMKYLSIGNNSFTDEDVDEIITTAPQQTFILIWDE